MSGTVGQRTHMPLSVLVEQGGDFRQRPHVVSHSGCHSGRGRIATRSLGERLVRPSEVIVHVVQGHRVGQVLDLLGEPVGQPREAAHAHPHGEVLSLDVGRRDE